MIGARAAAPEGVGGRNPAGLGWSSLEGLDRRCECISCLVVTGPDSVRQTSRRNEVEIRVLVAAEMMG